MLSCAQLEKETVCGNRLEGRRIELYSLMSAKQLSMPVLWIDSAFCSKSAVRPSTRYVSQYSFSTGRPYAGLRWATHDALPFYSPICQSNSYNFTQNNENKWPIGFRSWSNAQQTRLIQIIYQFQSERRFPVTLNISMWISSKETHWLFFFFRAMKAFLSPNLHKK